MKTGPVVSSANGNYGTGHNCFFTSPDGTEIWVSLGSNIQRYLLIELQNGFHATANSEGNCGGERYVMAQKITFNEDNAPIFGKPTPLDAVLQAPSGE